MVDTEPDHPGVITHPPFLYAGFAIAGVIINMFVGIELFAEPAQFWAGGGLIVVGAILLFGGVTQFRRAGTNVPTHKPTMSIVTTGLYGLTRNPLYLGLSTIYVGIGIAIDNVFLLVFLAPLLMVMRYGVIGREEAYLERKFGEEYRAYCTRVRRWL